MFFSVHVVSELEEAHRYMICFRSGVESIACLAAVYIGFLSIYQTNPWIIQDIYFQHLSDKSMNLSRCIFSKSY